MASFLYFVEGGRSEVPEAVGHAFDRRPIFHAVHNNGPHGGAGMLVADQSFSDKTQLIAFSGKEQTWRKLGKSIAWCGYWHDHPPTPGDLERDTMLPGDSIELNGMTFVAPKYLVHQGHGFSCQVPRKLSVTDDGEWATDGVEDRYAPFSKAAESFYEWFVGAVRKDPEAKPATLADMADWALAALAVNYRISRMEASMLGLLTERSAVNVLRSVIDWPMEGQKKSTFEVINS